jgi:hypothetical protein
VVVRVEEGCARGAVVVEKKAMRGLLEPASVLLLLSAMDHDHWERVCQSPGPSACAATHCAVALSPSGCRLIQTRAGSQAGGCGEDTLAAAEHSAAATVRLLSMAEGAVCFALDGAWARCSAEAVIANYACFGQEASPTYCTWIADLLAPPKASVLRR